MQRATAKRLLDARNACREAEHFTAGKTPDAILTDRGLQLILQTLLVTIGEALGHVRCTDPEVAQAIPIFTASLACGTRSCTATTPWTIPSSGGWPPPMCRDWSSSSKTCWRRRPLQERVPILPATSEGGVREAAASIVPLICGLEVAGQGGGLMAIPSFG